MDQNKKVYASPILVEHGSVETITGQNTETRQYLDQPFGSGTSYGDLTFSGPLR